MSNILNMDEKMQFILHVIKCEADKCTGGQGVYKEFFDSKKQALPSRSDLVEMFQSCLSQQSFMTALGKAWLYGDPKGYIEGNIGSLGIDLDLLEEFRVFLKENSGPDLDTVINVLSQEDREDWRKRFNAPKDQYGGIHFYLLLPWK